MDSRLIVQDRLIRARDTQVDPSQDEGSNGPNMQYSAPRPEKEERSGFSRTVLDNVSRYFWRKPASGVAQPGMLNRGPLRKSGFK